MTFGMVNLTTRLLTQTIPPIGSNGYWWVVLAFAVVAIPVLIIRLSRKRRGRE
jgi:Na+-driven multidrug efflux pump